jgi:hypothetical protein
MPRTPPKVPCAAHVPALDPNGERPENCYCSRFRMALAHACHVMDAGCGWLRRLAVAAKSTRLPNACVAGLLSNHAERRQRLSSSALTTRVDKIHSRRPQADGRSAAATQRFHGGQDRLKRSLINSGTQPEAVLGPGAVASCSTTTRRSTSPFR